MRKEFDIRSMLCLSAECQIALQTPQSCAAAVVGSSTTPICVTVTLEEMHSRCRLGQWYHTHYVSQEKRCIVGGVLEVVITKQLDFVQLTLPYSYFQ